MSATMVNVRERGILFSGEMARAILDGRKTQTRRIVKGHALEWLAPNMFTPEYVASLENDMCPYGKIGDRLYVRETWAGLEIGDATAYAYRADMPEEGKDADRWRPSIHMPRAASRITLEITNVRCERVQDISEADVLAEGITVDRAAKWTGIPWSSMPDLYTAFRYCWDHLNADRAPWDSNPWVWVISFRRVTR
jgi:hypothetical protein